jgi:predicted dehydrogenase
MGRNHLRAAMTCPHATLVAITDVDSVRAQAAAREFGGEAVSTSSLLGHIDAAIIAAPTALHVSLAVPLLLAGVHCLVEKPFAASEDECRTLIAAAEASDAVLQVGHVERFNPAVETMFAQGINASLVRKITARRMNPGSARVKDIDVVMDLMVHDLDVILALKKGVAVRDVGARGTADEAKATVIFADGCVATATASRLVEARTRDLDVALSDGFVRLDYVDKWVQVSRAEPGEEGLATVRPPVPVKDAIASQLADFVSCIQNQRKPRVSGADGLAVMSLAWQIQAAMAENA